MASLDDARTTLKRAHKHLMDLKAEIEGLRNSYLGTIGVKQNRADPKRVQYKLPNPLAEISAEIGSICANSLAVLDQIVFALFELRNGHPPPRPPKRRMQFPICEKREDFKARIKPDLEGILFDDIALIESLQPYNGRHWLARIKDMANEHKHRKLVLVNSGGRVQYHAWLAGGSNAYADPNAFVPFRVPGGESYTPKTMHVEARFSGTVAFADGSPVIDTLEICEAEIDAILKSFEPLFA